MGECPPRSGNCIDRREGLMTPQSPFDVSDEIQVALGLGAAVVALESAVVTHGLPYPANLQAAWRMERVIRQHGAVPAAAALIGGRGGRGGGAGGPGRLPASGAAIAAIARGKERLGDMSGLLVAKRPREQWGLPADEVAEAVARAVAR